MVKPQRCLWVTALSLGLGCVPSTAKFGPQLDGARDNVDDTDNAVPDPTSDASPDATLPLSEQCLPRCILDLFAECPFDDPCTVLSTPSGSEIRYSNGVRVRIDQAPDGGDPQWLYTKTDGVTPCASKTESGATIIYERLSDGRQATVLAVSPDLRTANCSGDIYTDVYHLPKCRALEQISCAGH